MGMRSLFFHSGDKQSRTTSQSPHKFLLFPDQSFSLSLYLYFLMEPRGSELNLFERGVRHPSVVKQRVLATGDALGLQ